MKSGHASVPAGFARAVAAGQPADAWLLLAPGRARARAVTLASAGLVLGAGDDPRGHPDCALFDPEEFGVDGLRVEHVAQRKDGVPSVEEALRYRPLRGVWRTVVLLDADRMNTDAQGALLKTAEEPPQGTLLLLSGCNLGAFLPALRSRCRVLRLGPEDSAVLERQAATRGISAEEWRDLDRCIGGEAALDLSAEQRAFLLERLQTLRAWRAGEDPTARWLEDPDEGGRAAVARDKLTLLLQAAMGELLRSVPDAPLAARWADALDLALADLEGNVTPGLVLARLRATVVGLR